MVASNCDKLLLVSVMVTKPSVVSDHKHIKIQWYVSS